MSARKKFTGDASGLNESVLLVEDDGNDVLLTTLAVRKILPSLPVKIVVNGEEAISYLRGDGIYADRKKYPLPGLVLLDLHMPRKTGFEVMEWIRQEAAFQQLPVIVFSSSATPSDVHEACRRGANSFLIKPLHFEDWVELLRSTVVEWMQNREIPQALRVPVRRKAIGRFSAL